MEFVSAIRKNRNRSRKKNVKRKRRAKRKLEVKGTTRRKATFSHNTTFVRDELLPQTMEAYTFWENYTAAQDWQKRHNIAWWKSRCHALEHENQILRQKIRSQASERRTQATSWRTDDRRKFSQVGNDIDTEVTESVVDDDENLEFEVDKEMLAFLEQSIRHKIELKRSRESAIKTASEEAANSEEPFITGEARMRAKTEDAKLLYGESSSRIMAMEAALQATMDRHKDRAKPHYWPNIPLKP